MMDDDIWETGEPEPFAPAPAVVRPTWLQRLCWIVAGALVAAVIVAPVVYFGANLIAMTALSQVLGQ